MGRTVLFAPLLGYRKEAEWPRLEMTISEAYATKVRVLRLPKKLDRATDIRENTRSKLEEMRKRSPAFEWDEREVDLFSIDDCLKAFAILYAEERGSDICVSLGTAGATGAIAGTVACLLWGGRGIYAGDPGYRKEIEHLPSWLHVEGPVSDEALRVLTLVVEEPEGLDKKTILEKLKAMGRIRKDQDKHAYRRLNTDFLAELAAQEFVTIGPRDAYDRRRHFVRATEEGRRACAVLSAMLEGPTPALYVRGRTRRVRPSRL